MKIIAHLGDAAITLVLLICTMADVNLKFIVGAILLMTFLGEIAKAFGAFVEPISDALKMVKQK